jgi:hypothetical protein
MDNPVELAIQGTQDKQKQNKKDSTISVGRHIPEILLNVTKNTITLN